MSEEGKSTILTVTMNPAIDKGSGVDVVVPERKLRCDTPRFEPGGGGINVSRALRKLGVESCAIYPSGGYSGSLLDDLLTEEGISTVPVKIREMTRINLIVYERSTGQQYRFGMPGQTLEQGDCERCLDAIMTYSPAPDYIVASGSLPPGVPEDFYARVVREARKMGAKAIIDTSGGALRSAVGESPYLVKINLAEFQALMETRIADTTELGKLCDEVVQSGKAGIFVVSLGVAGAFASWDGGCRLIHSPTVPMKSKVGAGDSMVAGILSVLARGGPVEDAIMMGVAAGAAAVMTEGSELCRREDAVRLFESMRMSGDYSRALRKEL